MEPGPGPTSGPQSEGSNSYRASWPFAHTDSISSEWTVPSHATGSSFMKSYSRLTFLSAHCTRGSWTTAGRPTETAWPLSPSHTGADAPGAKGVDQRPPFLEPCLTWQGLGGSRTSPQGAPGTHVTRSWQGPPTSLGLRPQRAGRLRATAAGACQLGGVAFLPLGESGSDRPRNRRSCAAAGSRAPGLFSTGGWVR